MTLKATEDFVIVLSKTGMRIPYKEGDDKTDLKFIKVEKGKDVPKEHIQNIVDRNLELLDLEYKDKKPILPKEYERVIPVAKEMKIKKRKYTQESLTVLYGKEGFSALKKIGEEFGVTDRSSRKLIVEILRAQEERQRKG